MLTTLWDFLGIQGPQHKIEVNITRPWAGGGNVSFQGPYGRG
jgi:hypothetical protein